MTEIDDLIDRATSEVEDVGEAAQEAGKGVKRLGELGETLADELESSLRDSRSALAELEEKLGKGGSGIRDRAQALLSGLQALGTHQDEGKARTGDLLEKVREGFADLKEDKEHFLDEAERQAQAAEAGLLAFAERVRQTEADAASRVQEARVAIAALTEKAEAIRGVVRERREILLTQVQEFEVAARGKLEGALQGIEAIGARLETQADEVVSAVQAQVDRVTDSLTDKFEREARERLLADAVLLKTRISAFEEFVTTHRERVAVQYRNHGIVTGQVEGACSEAAGNLGAR